MQFLFGPCIPLFVPSVTEILLILIVCFFFLGPMLLAFGVTMVRGKEYEPPRDAVRMRDLRKRLRRSKK